MGNRAIVVFENGKGEKKEHGPATYLHWNGGAASVYAFLQEMENRNIRKNDTAYESARFTHIVGDYFDSEKITSLSLGIMNYNGKPSEIDPGDNGVYIVNRSTGRVKRYVFGKFHKSADVAKEKAEALENKQYAGILEELAKDRKGKEIEDLG